MKVLLVNGSPHRNGCTAAALAEVASALRDEAVASDFFWIGTEPLGGCVACFQCRRKGKCVFDDKVKPTETWSDLPDEPLEKLGANMLY